MKGEMRYLVESNVYVIDYYENVTQSHEDRMDALRDDLSQVLRFVSEVELEVYMYNCYQSEIATLSNHALFINHTPNSDETYDFVPVKITNMDDFTELLRLLADTCEDFTIDDISFSLDDKSKMWFDLANKTDRVVDF